MSNPCTISFWARVAPHVESLSSGGFLYNLGPFKYQCPICVSSPLGNLEVWTE